MAWLYALVLFNLWMTIDAARRKVAVHWLVLILIVPFASVYYLFAVKLRGWEHTQHLPLSSPAEEVWELEQDFHQQPSARLSLKLADVYDKLGRHTEAISMYQHTLAYLPRDMEARHGLARAKLGVGQAEDAIEILEDLLNEDRAFDEFGAALDYAEALWLHGTPSEALATLEAIAQLTQRVYHFAAWAFYLRQAGKHDAARSVLEQGLAAYEQASQHIQEQDREWVLEIHKRLDDLSYDESRIGG
jgi:hypothetical protein